jgi:hypothetical protein
MERRLLFDGAAVEIGQLPLEAVTSLIGYIKVWNGSAWVPKPVKYWTGAAWITKPLKFWNGSTWITTAY